MYNFFLSGNSKTKNDLDIFGNKNTLFSILVFCLFSNKKIKIYNLSNILDLKNILKIFCFLGVKIFYKKNILFINSKYLRKEILDSYYVDKIRASILLLSLLIIKFRCLTIKFPGGCNLGNRLIDMHFYLFNKRGVFFDFFINHFNCYLYKNKLINIYFDFKKYSVGASQNFILSCISNRSLNIIKNIATEPELLELCLVLKNSGFFFHKIGNKKNKIIGTRKIKENNILISSDRIESCTYFLINFLKKKELFIFNYYSNSFISFFSFFLFLNIYLKIKKNNNTFFLFAYLNTRSNSFNYFFDIFPNLSTDLQPLLCSFLSFSTGISFIKDNIFLKRYNYIFELKKNFIDIVIFFNYLINKSIFKSCGNILYCFDLRAGASNLIISLNSKGISCLKNSYLISRGYYIFSSDFVFFNFFLI